MTKRTKGAARFSVNWTRKHADAAAKQGWGLFDVDRKRFEIEVCTENLAGFAEGEDTDAVAWMIKQALAGDTLCTRGLIFAALADPQRFASDMSELIHNKHVVLKDICGEVARPYSVVRYEE